MYLYLKRNYFTFHHENNFPYTQTLTESGGKTKEDIEILLIVS